MKRVIAFICFLIMSFCLSSCEPEDNITLFKKAYEQGNVQDQVICALNGGYLKNIGFSEEEKDYYTAMVKESSLIKIYYFIDIELGGGAVRMDY